MFIHKQLFIDWQTPGFFNVGQVFHLPGDSFLAVCPDPVTFDSQDRDSGAEYRPVVVVQGFGNMIEEKEDRQVSYMTEATAVFDSGHHPAEAQNDGKKDVDQQNGTDDRRRGGLTKMGYECFRRRQEWKVQPGQDADQQEEGQSPESPGRETAQSADFVPGVPKKHVFVARLFGYIPDRFLFL